MATAITLPAHLYAHTEVNVNDNTIRTYARTYEGNCKVLAVFISPKGIDNKLVTVQTGVDEFVEKFGFGPYSIYGQPYLNAYAAVNTGVVTLQCLRLTAENAAYANKHVYIQYKVDERTRKVTTTNSETGEETETDEKYRVLMIRFKAVSSKNLTDLKKLTSEETLKGIEPEPEDDTWTQERLISVACRGRGSWGDNIHFRISNHPRADKGNVFKNYFATVFEGTNLKEQYKTTINDNSIISGNSLFMDSVISDALSGGESQLVVTDTNPDILPTLFELYRTEVDPDTEIDENSFDPLLGINKHIANSRSQSYSTFEDAADCAITGVEISSPTGYIQLNTTLGFALENGDDGDFKVGSPNRDSALRKRYWQAFKGEIDRNILSKNVCPLDCVFDADFPIGDDKTDATLNVKRALAQFVTTRHEDCFCFMDLNTDFDDKAHTYQYSEDLDLDVNWWTFSIDAYYGKLKDPYSKRIITASSTYNLSINYPLHFNKYGGKHIPYAGSKYGIIDRFIPGSVFPVYDEDLDSDHLDKLVDMHVNYAQIDAKQNIIRGSQTTRYPNIGDALTMSNLTETNNALIILDIKKDAIKLVLDYSYNFNEAADLALFNRDAEQLVQKYAAAQVKAISAHFERTDEEAELGILHLYITVVHKALVKINMIDIDVNRAVETA